MSLNAAGGALIGASFDTALTTGRLSNLGMVVSGGLGGVGASLMTLDPSQPQNPEAIAVEALEAGGTGMAVGAVIATGVGAASVGGALLMKVPGGEEALAYLGSKASSERDPSDVRPALTGTRAAVWGRCRACSGSRRG